MGEGGPMFFSPVQTFIFLALLTTKKSSFSLRQRTKQFVSPSSPPHKPTFLPVLWTNFCLYTVLLNKQFFSPYLLNNFFSTPPPPIGPPMYHLVRPWLSDVTLYAVYSHTLFSSSFTLLFSLRETVVNATEFARFSRKAESLTFSACHAV